MILFGDGEFEISLITYKRSEYVRIWLEKTYSEAQKRNIPITVRDSSPDGLTRKVVEAFNLERGADVKYDGINPDTIIGYKPMIGIFDSGSEYVWVAADGRYLDFEELDEKIFPKIKEGIEWIVFYPGLYRAAEMVYTDRTRFLHECFIQNTCLGCWILKFQMFDFMMAQEDWDRVNGLFEKNYGFAFLGYLYTAFARSDHYRASFTKVTFHDISRELGVKKKQSWFSRFYGCWIDDLCQITDNIPDSYGGRDLVLGETWDSMHLDSWDYCYRTRKYGDLNSDSFEKYNSMGIIQKITRHPGRLKFFATWPMWCVETLYFMRKCCYVWPWKIVKKTLSGLYKFGNRP